MTETPVLDLSIRERMLQALAKRGKQDTELQWLLLFVDSTQPLAKQAGIEFRKYGQTIAVTDTVAVRPAQFAKTLAQMCAYLKYFARNNALNEAQKKIRLILVSDIEPLVNAWPQPHPLAAATKPETPWPTPNNTATTEEFGLYLLPDDAKPPSYSAPEPIQEASPLATTPAPPARPKPTPKATQTPPPVEPIDMEVLSLQDLQAALLPKATKKSAPTASRKNTLLSVRHYSYLKQKPATSSAKSPLSPQSKTQPAKVPPTLTRQHADWSLQPLQAKNPIPKTFPSNRHALHAWLATLAKKNRGEATRGLFRLIKQSNTVRLQAQFRFYLLEKVQVLVEKALQILQGHFMKSPLPLPPNKRRLARLSHEFLSEMGLGYAFLTQTTENTNALFHRNYKQLQREANHRAIHYLSRLLIAVYATYSHCPNKLWLTLHTLYRIALQGKYHSKRLSSKKGTHSTIDELYKSVLLLSLSSPYSMVPGECKRIYSFLLLSAVQIKLIPLRSRPTENGYFLVPQQQDSPPCYPELLDDNALQKAIQQHWLCLDSHNLLHKIQKSAKKGSLMGALATEPFQVTGPMLNDLAHLWKSLPSRSFSRHTQTDTVELIIGLSSLHWFLGGKDQHTKTTQATVNFAKTKPKPTSTLDLFNTSHLGLLDESVTLSLQPTPHKASAPPPSHELHLCRLQDEGAGGVQLRWSNQGKVKVQVGELIGMRTRNNTTTPNSWSIGVVRWVCVNGRKGLALGAQVLAPSAQAVALKTEQQGQGLDCLLLPALPKLALVESLLVPPFINKVASHLLWLAQGDSLQRVALKEPLTPGPCFAHYRFQILPDDAWPTSRAQAEIDQQYASLWSTL